MFKLRADWTSFVTSFLFAPRNLWSYSFQKIPHVDKNIIVFFSFSSFLEEQHLSLEMYMSHNLLFKGGIHSFFYRNFLTTPICSAIEDEAEVNMYVGTSLFLVPPLPFNRCWRDDRSHKGQFGATVSVFPFLIIPPQNLSQPTSLYFLNHVTNE